MIKGSIKFVDGTLRGNHITVRYECPPVVGDIVAIQQHTNNGIVEIERTIYGEVIKRLFENYDYLVIIVKQVEKPI